MKLNHLSLKNFRNYHSLDITFDPYINIFIGNNGQGKTNLLESIYLLSMSRSFKTHIIDELIQFNQDYAKIKGEGIYNNKDIQLEIILSTLGKKALINQTEIKKSSDYLGHMNVVLFVPEDLMLVKGSPKQRRNLLDMEISKISPIYMYNLKKYNDLLKERNVYLKHLHDNHLKPDLYLDVLSEQMAHIQVGLIHKRIEFVNTLNDIAYSLYDYISSSEQVLDISYKCTYKEIDENYILNKYKDNYLRDIKYSHTVDGIHKDDLNLMLDHNDAVIYASQGQQRSIVLSIKIALLELIKKEIGEYPILLLDDVLSELDDIRQTRLLNLIQDKVQTFLTTTSIDGINHVVIRNAKKIEIVNGEVKGE